MKETRTYYYLFSTVLGTCSIFFTEEAFPLKRICLPDTDSQSAKKQAAAEGRLPMMPQGALFKLCATIQAFLNGRPITAPWPLLDLSPLTPLQKTVLEVVEAIPYGQTRSYGHVAAHIGRPKAARFVGTTLRNNPFPLVVPCHRIIRSDGTLGLFAGGRKRVPLKRRLLDLERKAAQ